VQGSEYVDTTTRLYDLVADPKQQTPIDAPDVEARLVGEMSKLLREADAPPELFERLELV